MEYGELPKRNSKPPVPVCHGLQTIEAPEWRYAVVGVGVHKRDWRGTEEKGRKAGREAHCFVLWVIFS